MCRSGVPPKSILFWIFAKWRQSTLFSAGALWVRQVILGQYTAIDECSRHSITYGEHIRCKEVRLLDEAIKLLPFNIECVQTNRG